MRRLQGGRHRYPVEGRPRMFLAIPATAAFIAAATALWALDSPLDGGPVSGEATTAATADPATVLADLGEAEIRPQDAEAAPTSEAATSEAADEGGSGGEDSEGDDSGDDPGAPHADAEAAVLDLVNRERSDAGCGDLDRDSRLDAAARLHAEDMAANDYFSHTSLDGLGPTERAAEQGYQGGVGENIAAGYPDAASVMRGWMDSEGHRANLLNCGYTVIGIGVADRDGTLYWVQAFG